MSFPNEWKPGEKTSRLTVLLGYVNLMGRDDQGKWVESSSENCLKAVMAGRDWGVYEAFAGRWQVWKQITGGETP